MRYRRLDFYLSLTKIGDWNLWLIIRIVSAHHSQDTYWPSCMMRCDGHNFHGSIYPSERQELLFNGSWQAPACQSLPEGWIVTRRIICNIPSISRQPRVQTSTELSENSEWLIQQGNEITSLSNAGWWFGTWNLFFPFSWDLFIIPTDFHSIIFQRGRAQPPTRYNINHH